MHLREQEEMESEGKYLPQCIRWRRNHWNCDRVRGVCRTRGCGYMVLFVEEKRGEWTQTTRNGGVRLRMGDVFSMFHITNII